MINRTRFACIASLFALVACGSSSSSEGTLTVRGTLGSSAMLDNARAVAIGSNGTRHWAYLDRDGDFTLELPVGTSYRLLVANQLETGYQKTIGHVMITTTDGRSEWIGANETGTINLGKLRTASTVATTGDTSTHTQCGTCGGSSSGSGGESEADDDKESDDDDKEHGDDPKCSHESDDDDDKGGSKGSGSGYSEADDDDKGGGTTGTGGEKCKVCGSDEADDEELVPSKSPGDKCKDKEDNAKQPKKPKADKAPCPYKNEGGSSGSGSTKDAGGCTGSNCGGESGGSTSGSTKDAGACTGSGCSTDAGGSTSTPKKPEGSGCSTTSTCTSTCSCVAATCTGKY
jgi:hypothetical protein